MEDPYTIILRLLPVLLKFVLMCVTHKKEIIQLSSMKLLEFILETKGCSLDTSMVFILKAILTTYPAMPSSASQQSVSTSQQQVSKEGDGGQQQQQVKVLQKSDSFTIGNLSNSVQEYFQYQN